MHPIIAKVGPITIYSYGMLLAIAFLLGIYVARIEARRKNINQELLYDLAFYIIIGSVIGARLYYLAFFDPKTFITSPLSIFKVWQGGLAIHGGILGGIVAGILFSRRRKTVLLFSRRPGNNIFNTWHHARNYLKKRKGRFADIFNDNRHLGNLPVCFFNSAQRLLCPGNNV